MTEKNLKGPGANITRPRDQETTSRYNENDGVSKRVHELAFGDVICFVAQRVGADRNWIVTVPVPLAAVALKMPASS